VDRPIAVVYVRLLNDAIDVWAPVPAINLGNNRYRLTDDADYKRGLDEYEFPLGSTVMGEQFRDGSIRAVRLFESGVKG